MLKVVAVMMSTTLITHGLMGDVGGFERRTVSTGDSNAAVFADLDGDGDQDIVTSQELFNSYVWYENQGGTPAQFGLGQTLNSGFDSRPSGVLVADVDGDGDNDVIGWSFTNSTISWFQNNGGAGTFTPRRIATDIINPFAVHAADVDVDGDDDVFAIALQRRDALYSFESLGLAATFNRFERTFANVFFPTSLSSADVDGDGRPNLLVGEGVFPFWAGNSVDRPFEFIRRTFVSGSDFKDVVDLAAGDFDGDGDLDVAAALFNPGRLELWENEGQAVPTFNRQLLDSVAFISGVEVDDLDGDGDDDIAAYSIAPNNIIVYDNDGPSNLTFERLDIAEIQTQLSSLALGDAEGDGDIDLLLTTLNGIFGETILFEQQLVRNIDSGETFTSLQEAIDAAANGSFIAAGAGFFLTEPVLNVLNKTLLVLSEGDLTLPFNGVWTLEGSELGPTSIGTAFIDDDATISGRVIAHNAQIGADEINFGASSEVSVASGTELTLDSEPLRVRGSINVADGPGTPFGRTRLQVFGDTFIGVSAPSGSGDRTGAPRFVPRTVLPGIDAPNTPSAIASADLDGDGDDDLVAAFGSFGLKTTVDIFTFRSESDGTFTPFPIPGADAFPFVRDIAIGEFDGPGDRDFATVHGDQVRAWRAGNFLTGGITVDDTLTSASSVDVEDINNDARDDIAVADASNDRIVLYFSQLGTGLPEQFVKRVLAVGNGTIFDVEVSDLDGDGDGDLVWAEDNAGARWAENLGGFNPSFAVRATLPADAIDVDTADLDGDGDQDILTTASIGNVVRDAVEWYENTGTSPPTFERRDLTRGESVNPDRFEVTDVDRDGDVDLVVADAQADELIWYENDGLPDPSFTRRPITDVVPEPLPFTTGDFDGDGLTDVASGSFDSSVYALEQRNPASVILGENASWNARDISNFGIVDLAEGVEVFSTSFLNQPEGIIRVRGDADLFGFLTNDGELEIFDDAQSTRFNAFDGFIQSETGTLSVRISPTDSSRLNVQNNSAFRGTLVARSDAPLDLPVGTRITIVAGAAGLFDRFNLALLPGLLPDAQGNGRFFTVEYPDGSTRGPQTIDLVVQNLTGDLSTEPSDVFNVSGEPAAADAADLNGDGLIDLALAIPDPSTPDAQPGSLLVLLNAGDDGAGNWLGFGASIQIPVGVNPAAVSIGNVDDAGGLDIAIANRGSNTVTVFTNDGAATPNFTQAQLIAAGDEPATLEFGNFDNDPWSDLAVGLVGDEALRVYEDSSGSSLVFSREVTGLAGPVTVRWSNLDNDKWDDLAVTLSGSDVINVVRSFGPSLPFNTPIDLPVGDGPTRFVIGNLDNDKWDDLAVINRAERSLSIIRGIGGFGFESASTLPLDGTPLSIASVDLDGDGDLDLAIVTESAGGRAIRTFRNDLTNGELFFAPAAEIDSGGTPSLVLSADVDDDGRLDLIAVNSSGAVRGVAQASIGVARQSSPSTSCPGDADGNGLTQTADLTFVISNLGAGTPGAPGTPGDVNGDGLTTTDDVTFVVSNLGCDAAL